MTVGETVRWHRVLTVSPVEAFDRADLVFEDVDQGGGSFEVRAFLNNRGADWATPRSAEEGYAGSFFVYGYGVPPPGAGPRMSMARSLTVTEALRAALAGGDQVELTVLASGRREEPRAGLRGAVNTERIAVRFDSDEELG